MYLALFSYWDCGVRYLLQAEIIAFGEGGGGGGGGGGG